MRHKRDGERLTGVRTGRRFVWMMSAATAGPWLVVPVLASFDFYGGRLSLSAATVALATPHVATTLAFYLDPEMRGVLAEDRPKAVLLPLATIPLVWIGFVLLSGTWEQIALVGFAGWQLHHFGRQNLGVFAFVCMARGLRPDDHERRVFQIAGWAGVVGVMHTIGVPAVDTWALRLVALILLALAALEARAAPNDDPVRSAALIGGVLFFAPLLVFINPVAAAAGYGAAHGAQYLLMMAHLQNGREARAAKRMALITLGLFVGGGMLLVAMSNSGGWLASGVLAAAAAHFVADARLWKVRRPSQREYMARRFSFISQGATVGR